MGGVIGGPKCVPEDINRYLLCVGWGWPSHLILRHISLYCYFITLARFLTPVATKVDEQQKQMSRQVKTNKILAPSQINARVGHEC